MAVNRSSLHHTAASTGGDSRGVIKGKRTFNIWLMPAEDLACHPVLGSLSQERAKFALTYLSKALNIPPPRDQRGKPSVEELNRILLNHLVERRGQHVRVWCTLEIESDLCAGVQRIRCNPSKTKKGNAMV